MLHYIGPHQEMIFFLQPDQLQEYSFYWEFGFVVRGQKKPNLSQRVMGVKSGAEYLSEKG